MDLLVFLMLARWLSPQAFGLMALVSTVLVVVVMLAELGLAEALVQRKRLAGVAVDTAFWLLLGVGAVLAAGPGGHGAAAGAAVRSSPIWRRWCGPCVRW